MLDWKILAASFIALLIVSAVLASTVNQDNPLGDVGSKISDWLGTPPFSNPLEGGKPGATQILLKIRSPVTFEPDNAVNITGAVNVTMFEGGITFTPPQSVHLAQKTLTIDLPWKSFAVDSVKIGTLQLENASFEVMGNVSTELGLLDIRNFFGTVSTSGNDIVLEGNISKMSVEIGGLTWEVK